MHILLTLLLVLPVMAETEYIDLKLLDRGQSLVQTKITPQNPKPYFLIKQIFPAASSTSINNDVIAPSFASSNGKYRLYATLGQAVVGTSEDAANFRVTSGFFATARKSSFKVKGVRETRNPVMIQRPKNQGF